MGITADLRRLVAETAKAIRAMLVSGRLPAPVNDGRCRECSLKEICQPETMADKEMQRRQHHGLFMVEE